MKIEEFNTTEGNKRKVRLMPNKHWSLPFSCAFVMKRIDGFVPEECSINVLMTVLMRIKFTGLPEIVQVQDFIKGENTEHAALYGKKAFRVRANEVEGEIIDAEF